MLARQIENGAPYDVYLAANQTFVDELQKAGKMLPETVRAYSRGRLALWSRSGRYRSLGDLAAPGVRHVAIANPAHAPYGVAAREALQRQGLWEKLAGRIVYGENVQQTLQFAETGNAEAAITAWSLVIGRGGVLLPASLHTPIRQVGGVVAGTRHPAQAKRFIEFLTGPQGQEILARHGFTGEPGR